MTSTSSLYGRAYKKTAKAASSEMCSRKYAKKPHPVSVGHARLALSARSREKSLMTAPFIVIRPNMTEKTKPFRCVLSQGNGRVLIRIGCSRSLPESGTLPSRPHRHTRLRGPARRRRVRPDRSQNLNSFICVNFCWNY